MPIIIEPTGKITVTCDNCGNFHNTDFYNDENGENEEKAIEAARMDDWDIRYDNCGERLVVCDECFIDEDEG